MPSRLMRLSFFVVLFYPSFALHCCCDWIKYKVKLTSHMFDLITTYFQLKTKTYLVCHNICCDRPNKKTPPKLLKYKDKSLF